MCYIPVTRCSLPEFFHVLHRLSCISLWSAPYLFSQLLLNVCLLVDFSPLHYKYAVTNTILYLHLCTFTFLSNVSIRIHAAWLRIKIYHGNILLKGSAPVSTWMSVHSLCLSCSGFFKFVIVWGKTKYFSLLICMPLIITEMVCFLHRYWLYVHFSTPCIACSYPMYIFIFVSHWFIQEFFWILFFNVYTVYCFRIYKAIFICIISYNPILSFSLWPHVSLKKFQLAHRPAPLASYQWQTQSGLPQDGRP